MFPILIVSFLTAVLAVAMARRFNSERRDKIFYSIVGGLFGALLGGAIGFIIAVLLGANFVPQQFEATQTTHLVGISNVQGVQASGSGGFFLWTFEASNVTYYDYWYQDGDGYRHGQMTDADNVKIIEDANANSASIVTYSWVCDSNVLNYVAICGPNGGVEHDFHVPPGTIVHDFTLTPGGEPEPSSNN